MTSNDEVDSSHSHPLFGSKSAHSHLLEREHAKPKASKVYDSLSNITELSLRSGLEKQARPPDSLRARLFRRLRIENSALKEIGQPERDVNLLGTKIWNTLKSQAHEFDDCTIQWCDQYCTLPCRDKSKTSVPCWDELFRDPFIASVDGIRPIAFHSDGTIGYHIPENFALTTWAFNLFCGAWPKIILPLTKISSQARTKAELNYVTTSFRNLVYTSHENDKALTARLKSTITRSQIAELHEAMRTAQPLATGVFNRQLKISEENWSTGKQSNPSKKTLDYRYKQLRGIARQFKYRGIPERLWLREGVFFPFSEPSYPERWTQADCEAWFKYRVGIMKKYCDRDNDTTLNVDILMQVVLRRLLDMAQEIEGEPDQDHPGENLWVVRDRVGLELWPYDDTPCTASIAHKIHGQVMTTGYWEGDEYPEYTTWDAEKCNILFESWCWNCEKFNFPAEYEDEMLERHLSLREGPEIKEIWEIRSPADVRSDPAFQTTCLPSDSPFQKSSRASSAVSGPGGSMG